MMMIWIGGLSTAVPTSDSKAPKGAFAFINYNYLNYNQVVMYRILVNDKKTDTLFASLQEAIKWIESRGKCYPTGFSLTEFLDPDSTTFYNIVEEKD